MKSRLACSLVLLLAVSALAGCSSLRTVTDFFDSAGKKTKIQGERISIIASEGQLSTDPQLAASKMDLPPPKKNAEWTGQRNRQQCPGQSWPMDRSRRFGALPPARILDDNSRLTAPSSWLAVGLCSGHAEPCLAFDAKTGKPLGTKALLPGKSGSRWYTLVCSDPAVP
jgi:hypothetical protein